MPKFMPGDLEGWLALAPLIMQLIDFIVSMIERLFPKKPGEEKKAIAMSVATAMVPDLPSGETLAPSILSNIIDNQVSLNNQAGNFLHAEPTDLIIPQQNIYST